MYYYTKTHSGGKSQLLHKWVKIRQATLPRNKSDSKRTQLIVILDTTKVDADEVKKVKNSAAVAQSSSQRG